jgi:DNA-binding CsgD family transcriptional regulator
VVGRARIVLRAAAGEANKEIAQAMGVTPRTVSGWCKRFLALGLPGLQKDTPGKKNYPHSRKPGFRGEQAKTRRAAVVRLRADGLTLQQIADVWDVSRQRVHQLLERAKKLN